MPEKRVNPSTKEYNMAYKDVSDDFKDGFMIKANGVIDSKDRKSKIKALSLLMLDLNAYTRFHKIDKDDIDEKRRIKEGERGLFTKGFILIRGHVEKLVRDRIPEIYPENQYRRSRGQELLRFLDLKVVEESIELTKSTPQKRLEEVADLTEVIFAVMNFNNIRPDEVITIVQSVEDIARLKSRRKLASKSK